MRLHTTDKLSLLFGLVFVGISMLSLAISVASLDAETVGWMMVGGLATLGIVGVALLVSSARRHSDDRRP